MKVILKEDVEKLGKSGDTVEVARGYARNYLLPRGFALEATPGNIKFLEGASRREARRLKTETDDATELAASLSKASCTVPVLVGKDDKMFGSVTAADIAQALTEKGFEVDKRRILIKEPIKELGIYRVPIRLHQEGEAQVKVWVVKK